MTTYTTIGGIKCDETVLSADETLIVSMIDDGMFLGVKIEGVDSRRAYGWEQIQPSAKPERVKAQRTRFARMAVAADKELRDAGRAMLSTRGDMVEWFKRETA